MKKLIVLVFVLSFLSCSQNNREPEMVFEIEGQQLTGICIDEEGKIFVNFPRWREDVENSVVEVIDDKEILPFPDQEWNSWEIGKEIKDSVFIAVQSIASYHGKLYVLDTRNPLFKGVVDAPRVFVFDVKDKTLLEVYKLSEDSYHKNSYINDLRLDTSSNIMYFTDSGVGGLIAMDLNNGLNKRVLDKHFSTSSEVSSLNVDGIEWNNTVHSDGIALDTSNNNLYFHSLTGYNLYSINTGAFGFKDEKLIEDAVKLETKTPAPDGMIVDLEGNLYLSDLENDAIYTYTKDKELIEIYRGDAVSWADSFAIHNNELYYTNSRIHEAGNDISSLVFSIYKMKI